MNGNRKEKRFIIQETFRKMKKYFKKYILLATSCNKIFLCYDFPNCDIRFL